MGNNYRKDTFVRHIDQLKISIPEFAKAPEGSEAFERLVEGKAGGKVRITKRSFDFRNKREPVMVLAVDVFRANETIPALPTWNKLWRDELPVKRPDGQKSPVVIGSGPAGLFCALWLAKAGLNPIVIERGSPADQRAKDVRRFWQEGLLNPNSNVQFGEGGAGTFSDGKLTTLVKEKNGLGHLVTETFIAFGAPEEIRISGKPHIGTDVLRDVVMNIRKEICRLGGRVLFNTTMTDLICDKDKIQGIICAGPEGTCTIDTDKVFLCVGHSARDTFEMLVRKGVRIEQKPFSVGLRIQHPQELIDAAQYGVWKDTLGRRYPADYKLSHRTPSGRGIYTFCMCPGGFVVNAASEEGHIVTNGMSNYDRASGVANSAVLVSVTPEDYTPYAISPDDVLAGMRFQRHLEQKAFLQGGGTYALPCQTVGDFLQKTANKTPYETAICGSFVMTDLTQILPAYVTRALREGLPELDGKLKGFADPRATFTRIETRSSSPVRIVRDPLTGNSNIEGLFPVGEGAGYAGGIMSSAIDGIRMAKMAYQLFF